MRICTVFLFLCILIHLFSKTLQFWEYAQFFSSYKRADAWCMYISHQKNTTFSLECESETRTWQGLILLILCRHNLFCHHFFIGAKRCNYFLEFFFNCNILKKKKSCSLHDMKIVHVAQRIVLSFPGFSYQTFRSLPVSKTVCILL